MDIDSDDLKKEQDEAQNEKETEVDESECDSAGGGSVSSKSTSGGQWLEEADWVSFVNEQKRHRYDGFVELSVFIAGRSGKGKLQTA